MSEANDNNNMDNFSEIAEEEDLFTELNSLKSTLAAKNQPLIPTLIKIFVSFKNQIVADLHAKLDETVTSIKNDCLSVCVTKDAKIKVLETSNHLLKKQISSLEDKLDATEAYARKDTVIISGAIPGVTANENTNEVVVGLIKNKLSAIDIDPIDISVSHRLQNKRPNEQGVTYPPNIYVKLVRRNLKKALINASKRENKQNKNNPNKIYINESLTPRRIAVLQTLLKIKKSHNIIRGVTSQDGDVCVFTPGEAEAGTSGASIGDRRRDKRHRINTRDELRKFCADYLQKPLEDYVATWPAL